MLDDAPLPRRRPAAAAREAARVARRPARADDRPHQRPRRRRAGGPPRGAGRCSRSSVLLLASTRHLDVDPPAGDAIERDRAAAVPEADDPQALERAAEAAERDGEWERAVRLRFRAGLLRLDRRKVLVYRPSLTTGEVARALEGARVRRGRRALRRDRLRRPGRRARGRRGVRAGLEGRAGRRWAPVKLLPESRQARLAIGIVGVIVGLNLIAIGVDALVPEPGGPALVVVRDLAPGPGRLEAELAERSGREVAVVRERLSDARCRPRAPWSCSIPRSSRAARRARCARFAEGGGRVIAGALEPGPWIDEFGARLDWAPLGARTRRSSLPTGDRRSATAYGRRRPLGRRERGALPIVADADGLPVVVVRQWATARSCSSPTRRRCRTGCSTRPTTPRFGARARRATARSCSPRDRTATARRPGSTRCRPLKVGAHRCSPRRARAVVARWPRLGPPEQRRAAAAAARAYVDALAATLARTRDRGRRGRARALGRARAAGAPRRTRRATPTPRRGRGGRAGGARATTRRWALAGRERRRRHRRGQGARPAEPAERGSAVNELTRPVAGEVGKVVVGQER